MTDADKHFGSDPADIWIRTRINLEIWIQIQDHFWLTLDALVEVCNLWAQSRCFVLSWAMPAAAIPLEVVQVLINYDDVARHIRQFVKLIDHNNNNNMQISIPP